MMAITTSNSMREKARQEDRRANWLRAPAQRFDSREYVFMSRVIIQSSVIVGLGSYLSSSGTVPLSRELDPLFRSEVRKPPIRTGRREPRWPIEHLAGLGARSVGILRTRL